MRLQLPVAHFAECLVELPVRRKPQQRKIPSPLAIDAGPFANYQQPAFGIDRAAVRELDVRIAGSLSDLGRFNTDGGLSRLGKRRVCLAVAGKSPNGESLPPRIARD